MTLITFSDGKIVMRDGKVGTEQACCCCGFSDCNCECTVTVTVNGFSLLDIDLPCPDPSPFPECVEDRLKCRRMCESESTQSLPSTKGYDFVVSSGHYQLSCSSPGVWELLVVVCSEWINDCNDYSGGPCNEFTYRWISCPPLSCPSGEPDLVELFRAPTFFDYPEEITSNDCMTATPVISIECNPLP
jgi:hypothetical protein